MRVLSGFVPLIAFLGLGLTPAMAQPVAPGAVEGLPWSQVGPCEVTVLDQDWLDGGRRRQVPVRIYYPESDQQPCPVVVFSHGLGGSREGYEYLGRHWASHGYVSVHLQHIGSDTAVWQGSQDPMGDMRRAAARPANAINRPLDVRFALDRLAVVNAQDGVLRGKLDMAHVGMAGHSFGAYTTLAAAGQVFATRGDRQVTLSDPRIKAAIPMSAPVPSRGSLDTAFGAIAIPCLHMTGTLDDSLINETRAAQRRLPFDHSPGPDKYLVTFEGGDHMIFSGRGRRANRPGDALFQGLIRTVTTAFWNAYLRDDADAKAWLTGEGVLTSLGRYGAIERK